MPSSVTFLNYSHTSLSCQSPSGSILCVPQVIKRTPPWNDPIHQRKEAIWRRASSENLKTPVFRFRQTKPTSNPKHTNLWTPSFYKKNLCLFTRVPPPEDVKRDKTTTTGAPLGSLSPNHLKHRKMPHLGQPPPGHHTTSAPQSKGHSRPQGTGP